MVSNRTDEGTSSYPADLMNTNTLLEFSLKYVNNTYVTRPVKTGKITPTHIVMNIL